MGEATHVGKRMTQQTVKSKNGILVKRNTKKI